MWPKTTRSMPSCVKPSKAPVSQGVSKNAERTQRCSSVLVPRSSSVCPGGSPPWTKRTSRQRTAWGRPSSQPNSQGARSASRSEGPHRLARAVHRAAEGVERGPATVLEPRFQPLPGTLVDHQGHGLVVAARKVDATAGDRSIGLEPTQELEEPAHVAAPVEVVPAADERRPGRRDPVEGIVEDAGSLQRRDERGGHAVDVAEGPHRPVIGDPWDAGVGHEGQYPRQRRSSPAGPRATLATTVRPRALTARQFATILPDMTERRRRRDRG